MEPTKAQPVPTPATQQAIIRMVAQTPAPWWAEALTLADLVGTAEDRRFDL